jgi:hypothetical protein
MIFHLKARGRFLSFSQWSGSCLPHTRKRERALMLDLGLNPSAIFRRVTILSLHLNCKMEVMILISEHCFKEWGLECMWRVGCSNCGHNKWILRCSCWLWSLRIEAGALENTLQLIHVWTTAWGNIFSTKFPEHCLILVTSFPFTFYLLSLVCKSHFYP